MLMGRVKTEIAIETYKTLGVENGSFHLNSLHVNIICSVSDEYFVGMQTGSLHPAEDHLVG